MAENSLRVSGIARRCYHLMPRKSGVAAAAVCLVIAASGMAFVGSDLQAFGPEPRFGFAAVVANPLVEGLGPGVITPNFHGDFATAECSSICFEKVQQGSADPSAASLGRNGDIVDIEQPRPFERRESQHTDGHAQRLGLRFVEGEIDPRAAVLDQARDEILAGLRRQRCAVAEFIAAVHVEQFDNPASI